MRSITFLLFAFIIFSFHSFYAQDLNNPWVVPDEFKVMENPVEANKSSISEGKSLYKQHCKVCHGKDGQGDGYKAEVLQVDPSDLTLDDMDVQKDGEIYYKIITGREEMHSYKVVLEDEEIWHLVNYIRTLYMR